MSYHSNAKFQFLVILSVFSVILSCQKKQKFSPPKTTKIEFEYEKFDEKIKDPYQWLENEDSLPVKTWIKQQDDFTKKYIDENLETKSWVENRMQELTEDVNYDTPILSENGKRFFIENNYEKSQPVLKFQKDDSSPYEVLVDPNQLSEDGSIVLSNFIPSPSGKFLLYSLSNGNSRYRDWKLLEVDTKSELKDVTPAASINIQSWLPNDEGYIYRTYQNLNRNDESFVPNTYLIKKHIIGQDSSKDQILYTAKKGEVINAFLNDDAKHMIVVNGTTTTDVYLKGINQDDKPLQILSGKSEGAYYQFIHNQGNKYWFLTTENSPNGKVIEVEVSKRSLKKSKEIISVEDESINQAFVFGKHFVLHTLNKAKPYLRVYDLEGNSKDKVDLPVGLTWNSFTPAFQQGISGHKNRSDIYIRSQGLTASNSVYKYDIEKGVLEMYQKSTTPFQSENYMTKQVFYKSKDGTEVPMFITHKKGLKLDGKNPALVYVYGSFGWTALPFITRKYALFLEQGGIHVMPNIRGGGALGADWYKAGRSLQKKNGIDDTVAALEWLIDNKYTSSEKVIIEGNSAGGIVAMSAVNKAPSLFKVALLEFPIFDMAKAMEFNKSASRWKSQFGDPSKEEDFKYLYSYSPYHHVKKGENYPSVLIAAGEKDRVASPIHSYKMTARLQENQKNPSLLWVNWDGGHGGKNEKERTQLRIAELIFVFNELNIAPK